MWNTEVGTDPYAFWLIGQTFSLNYSAVPLTGLEPASCLQYVARKRASLSRVEVPCLVVFYTTSWTPVHPQLYYVDPSYVFTALCLLSYRGSSFGCVGGI